MIGPQIGALFEFYVDNRWWVNVDMKAAIMNNHSHQSTTYTNVNAGTTTVYSGTAQEDHTAFAEEIVGDGRLSLVAAFHDANRLQGPVDAKRGLAPDNLNTNIDILTLGPAQLNHGSSTLYHGPYAGVVLAW